MPLRNHNSGKLYSTLSSNWYNQKSILEQSLPTLILLKRVTWGGLWKKTKLILMEEKVNQAWPLTPAYKTDRIHFLHLELIPLTPFQPQEPTCYLLNTWNSPFYLLFPLLETTFPGYTCELPLSPSCLYLEAAFPKSSLPASPWLSYLHFRLALLPSQPSNPVTWSSSTWLSSCSVLVKVTITQFSYFFSLILLS